MNQWKQTLLATALIAGLCLTAQAQDTAAPQTGAQQQQPSDQPLGAQPLDQQQPADPAAAQPAGAREQADRGLGQQGAMSPDAMFVKHAAMGNLKAVKLAEIAAQKSSSEEVKQVAQAIVRDHQQANTELSQVAQKLGVQIPQALPADKQEAISYFESLQGKQFDQEYISATKAQHAAAISILEDKAQIAESPELKQWAQQGLAKMQEHQQHVFAAAQAVGLPGEGATARGQGTDTAQPAGGTIDGTGTDRQPSGATETPAGGTSGAPGTSLDQGTDRR